MISGTGGLIKLGNGAMTLSGANTYSGLTSVNAGIACSWVPQNPHQAAASDITVASGATLNLNNFAEAAGSIAGAGNITLGSARRSLLGGDNAFPPHSQVFSPAPADSQRPEQEPPWSPA